ncbi:hypothetical protein [Amycolatopsis sp. Poz14]|uniref:hypothetical protein n=1 Tax=Amycolatopsis sp. Poz14 TaxID=1447705 RepID=UPI001EE83BED|nr:hypothetical protein [Amycolatopsis sp. Poz14]MCG3748889.1 hypothetical protein [Amycolatopsis sp. Poz14]
MSTWAENRRADRAAAAEQSRKDAAAKLDRTLSAAAHRAAERRADQAAAADLADQRRAARKASRQATRAQVRGWLAANRVRLPIYLLAVVSAVMAIPAMAGYGRDTYGDWTGAALPALSELGMWAFALAVEVTRHRHPDRPVWALQTGVWVFAGVGFGLNVLHGLHRGWDAAMVMGIVSVAGVVAHQIAVAAPRRSREERHAARAAADAARIERDAARKVAKVRRVAVRDAVAEIGADGSARLVFTPGRYVLRRHLRGSVLTGAIEPSAPVGEVLADEIGAWLATQDQPTESAEDNPIADAAVSTLDRPSDQRKSTPRKRTHPAPKTRTIAQLREAFAAAIEDPKVSIDPASAESIRKALKCAPKAARQLRDEYKADHQ